MGSRVCGAVGRRRRHGARGAHCCYLPRKIQNSKFDRGCGQILNFEFCKESSSSARRARRARRDDGDDATTATDDD